MNKKVIFGQIGRLKTDKIQDYESLHAQPWPEVMNVLHSGNLQNYSIFREGTLVFSYYEYIGDDYEADMEKMGKDESMQRWLSLTRPCFEEFGIRSDSIYYADMKQLFFLA